MPRKTAAKKKRQKAQARQLDEKLHRENMRKRHSTAVVPVREARPNRAGRDHHARARAVVSAVQSSIRKNSACWVKSMLQPFEHRGCRYPEAISSGTATCTLAYSKEFAVRSGSTSGFFSAVVFSPALTDFYREATAGSTPFNVASWSAVDHPKQTSLEPLVATYRVVSMGFRLHNIGSYLNQGAIVGVGMLPPRSTVQDPDSNLLTEMQAADTIRWLRASEVDDDHVEVVWLPAVGEPSYASADNTSGAVSAGYNALSWKEVTNSAIVDNRIVFFLYSENASSPSDVMYVETVMNIEYIPAVDDQYLFTLCSAVGSEEGTAEAWIDVLRELAKRGLGQLVNNGVRLAREKLGGYFSFSPQATRSGGMGAAMAGSLTRVKRRQLHDYAKAYRLVKALNNMCPDQLAALKCALPPVVKVVPPPLETPEEQEYVRLEALLSDDEQKC